MPNGEDTQNFRLGRIEESLLRIESKLADAPIICEGHRGGIHERINKLYLWMLGTGGTIIVGLAFIIVRG